MQPPLANDHGDVESEKTIHAIGKMLMLEQWNDTEAAYPSEQCIHELFETQVEKDPNAVAVVCEDKQLTYAQLNVQANQVAHYLRGLGVKPDDRVAICIERGLEMVVGLLGILKAGGAYVPLDPTYPAERLGHMLKDSAPVALLTQSNLRDLIHDIPPDCPIVDLTAPDPVWANQPLDNPDPTKMGLTSRHLAYVIYTSGSTGIPKGVMIEHTAVINLIKWHCDTFGLRPGKRSSSLARFGFDAATWEILPTLCGGGLLMLPSASNEDSPDALLEWWANQRLDVAFLPTPIAEIALARGIINTQLSTLLIGGDCLRHLPRHSFPFSLVNNYGPTEATVVATSGVLTTDDRILHIGRPISNTRIYILDARGEPVPVGVAGELYISGAGVARGYLNRPELTAERFVADLFSKQPGARMYRTGDLGRWLPDGNIEFLGRNDFQVKIRGFRIELGEIEARLRQCPGVHEAVVLAREETPGGDKRLVAYYMAKERGNAGAAHSQSGPTAEELRSHLLVQLPEYMVPAAYVRLTAFPLTPNGKLDRNALPAPEVAGPEPENPYAAPRNSTEEILANIWEDVLKINRVGVHDNFFDLGGHSLLATQILSRIRKTFKARIALRDFFRCPSIAELACLLETPNSNPALQALSEKSGD